MLKKWNEFNSINEKKKDPNAPKFGTPEYWAYLKDKKKGGDTETKDDGKKCKNDDCECPDCVNNKKEKKDDKKKDDKKKK